MFHPQLRRKAFSLVELLVVIGIIAIMAVLASTAFTFIGRAGGVTKTGQDIAGILEQARAHAMAHNTYVWVGFKNNADDSLTVGTVASRNGESQPTVTDTTQANSGLVQLDRLKKFPNARLVVAPSGDRPPVDSSGQVANLTTPTLSFTTGTPTAKESFGPSVVQFNSRGEARVSSAQLNKVMELGLQSYSGGAVRNPENYSAVQIAGLSGAVTLYRP